MLAKAEYNALWAEGKSMILQLGTGQALEQAIRLALG